MKKKEVKPIKVTKVTGDESLEDLLEQLRASQGPGDALLEINSGGIKVTTAAEHHGKFDENTPVHEEVVDWILQGFIKEAEYSFKYSRAEINKAAEVAYQRFEEGKVKNGKQSM